MKPLIYIVIGLLMTTTALALNSPFNEGWQRQIGQKSHLQSMDDQCQKGQIMARYSDATLRCTWPGDSYAEKIRKQHKTTNTPTPQPEPEPECWEVTKEVCTQQRLECENWHHHWCTNWEWTCTEETELTATKCQGDKCKLDCGEGWEYTSFFHKERECTYECNSYGCEIN